MRTVIAADAAVAHMRDVGIHAGVVICIGDLGTEIIGGIGVQLAFQRIQLRLREQFAGGAGLIDRILKRRFGKHNVRRIQAGIDDRNAAARASVAQIPCGGRADHVFACIDRSRLFGRVVCRHVVGGQILGFKLHGLHAAHTPDLYNIAEGDLDGDRVDKQRQVPFDRQLVADRPFDACLKGVLLAAQFRTIGDRLTVLCNAARIEALVDRGLAVQKNRDADDLIRIIGAFLFGGRFRFIDLSELFYMQRRRIEGLCFEHDRLRRLFGRIFRFGLFVRAFCVCARNARCERHREQHERRDQHGKKSFPA